MLKPLPTVFQLYCGGQCSYPWFPGVLLTSTTHNILSKPLAAYPRNHRRSNGKRWERNESCGNDYHQSSERILAEPGIEPATSCSQVRNTTDWVMGLGAENWPGAKILSRISLLRLLRRTLVALKLFTTPFKYLWKIKALTHWRQQVCASYRSDNSLQKFPLYLTLRSEKGPQWICSQFWPRSGCQHCNWSTLNNYISFKSQIKWHLKKKKIDWFKLKAFADDKIIAITKIEIRFLKGRKHCWKRRKCWLPAFSSFPTIFFKVLSYSCVQKSWLYVKELS